MGSSVSCLCPEHQSPNAEVIVMKNDGESIRLREGTLVKEVLQAHTHHKIIPCRSNRSALPNSYRMCCNQLYFLLPEEVALCHATYDSLVRAAMSKGLIRTHAVKKGGGRKETSEFDGTNGVGQVVVMGKILELDDFGWRKSPWRPSLQDIPEGITPPMHANV